MCTRYAVTGVRNQSAQVYRLKRLQEGVVDTSGWQIEHIFPTTTIWRKMSRYREMAEAQVPWQLTLDQVVGTTAYHRPLSWYCRTLRAAGLLIAALEEPEPTEELAGTSQASWIAEVPLHLVIEAWKVG